jgi:hypothetical protein
MSESKENLLSFIKDGVSNITNDCRSFVYSKLNGDLDNVADAGGGNLLSAMGLMAALEYLSKIYLIWDKGWPTDRQFIHQGRINALAAVEHFIQWSELSPIYSGATSFGNIWSDYRNGLAHNLRQKLKSETSSSGISNYIGTVRSVSLAKAPQFKNKWKEYLEQAATKPFQDNDGNVDLHIESMIIWIDKAANALESEISISSDNDRIAIVWHWLEKELTT